MKAWLFFYQSKPWLTQIGQDKEYDSHNDDRIKYPSSLKAQEDFIETEVAEDALYKDLVAVFTPQVIALRLHTAGKK